jgi:hypothetical protein
MFQFSFSTVVALASSLLTCLAFILVMHFRKKASRLTNDLDKIQEKLAVTHTDLQALQQRYQDSLDFQKNLSEAELTTRLQQPRLSAQHGHSRITAPERYLYVRSLAQNGMGAEEIASVLSISVPEAEQLVNLAKLGSYSS